MSLQSVKSGITRGSQTYKVGLLTSYFLSSYLVFTNLKWELKYVKYNADKALYTPPSFSKCSIIHQLF